MCILSIWMKWCKIIYYCKIDLCINWMSGEELKSMDVSTPLNYINIL